MFVLCVKIILLLVIGLGEQCISQINHNRVTWNLLLYPINLGFFLLPPSLSTLSSFALSTTIKYLLCAKHSTLQRPEQLKRYSLCLQMSLTTDFIPKTVTLAANCIVFGPSLQSHFPKITPNYSYSQRLNCTISVKDF